jgi:cytochrome o ubiquinol oxidase operon protein cyoD
MSQRDNIVLSKHGTLTTYTLGVLLSIILTIVPYVLVDRKVMDGQGLIMSLIGFAISQVFIQLIFFLHLNRESRPRLNIMAFMFMVVVVFIVVGGSLWIMANLNYHHGGHNMSPKETDTYIFDEEGIKR